MAPPGERQVLVRYEPTRPVVTYVLMGISIVVFVLQQASQSFYSIDLPAALGAKINEAILAGELWRFFTPMFLHGGIMHILFNMYALYSLGPVLEQHYGYKRFLVLYLLAGFAGNVASFIFTAAPSLGSSTAIFGLLAAYGVFIYQNKGLFGDRARNALVNIISIAVINLIIGLAPMIDNWGHVGGLVGGALFAWMAGPVLQPQGVFPTIKLVDERDTNSVVLASAVVGGGFAILAFVMILLRLL